MCLMTLTGIGFAVSTWIPIRSISLDRRRPGLDFLPFDHLGKHPGACKGIVQMQFRLSGTLTQVLPVGNIGCLH